MSEEKEVKSNKKSVFTTMTAITSRIVEVGLLVLLFVVAISTFFPGKNLTGQYRLFTVMSGSMEPAISTGSLILSQAITSANPDQIIVYEDPRSDIANSFVAHRVVEVGEEDGQPTYTTKGDANEFADRYTIKNQDLIGSVQFSIPKLGYLSAYAQTPQGLVLLAILPALLIVVMELRHMVKTFDTHYKKKYAVEQDHKKDLTTSSIIIVLGLGLSVAASSTGVAALFTGKVGGVNDTFASAEWVPDASVAEGWNLESLSASQNEQPLDIACPVGDDTYYTNENSLSFNWSEVDSPLPQFDIRYVRENTRPDLSTILVPGGGSYPQNYTTPWGSFGAGSGEYLTKVKAFVDVNANGQLDPTDFESDWSNSCSITYDPDAPEFPGQPGWATETPASGYQGDGVDLDNFVPCGGSITQTGINYYGVWGEATDDLVGFDHYERQVVYNDALVFSGSSPLNYAGPFQAGGVGPNGGDGQYYVRVRAIDQLGNATIDDAAWTDTSTYATWCGLTIDTASPTSSITVTSSPTRSIEERVLNGDFEDGLTNWQTIGDVSLVDGPIIDGNSTKMVQIGTDNDDPGFDGNSVDVNILSQNIPHTSQGNGVRSIGFWYNFMTYEPENGYDEPGFMVFVGNKMVHQVWASDIVDDSDLDSLDKTGWRFLSLNFSQVDDPTLTLAFYSGNTDDLTYQSFVYIDDVTSNEAVVNSEAVFELAASDNQEVATVHYSYYIGEDHYTESGAPGLTFTLAGQPNNGIIEYWSEDTAGNIEEHNTFHVLYDDVAPEPVTDLTVFDDDEGNFTLEFTAPTDANPFAVNQAADYDIRYSTEEIDPAISNQDWALLPEPSVLNIDGLPGGGTRAPLVSGNTETYVVHVSDGPATYYFAVKAADRAGNWSDLLEDESIATTGEETADAPAISPGDVVINEIMWMGSKTMPHDEWIELRNLTNQPISLAGWIIKEAGTSGSPDIALPVGAEIPANGFYLVANLNQADSEINVEPDFVTTGIELSNSSEELILVDTTATEIDKTPDVNGSWVAGSHSPFYRSMERNNIPADGTDTANWHTCDSDSCADARETYWDSVDDNYGTPKGENLSFDESQISTAAELTWADQENMQLKLMGIQMFTTAEYTLLYHHLVDGQIIQDALTGSTTFAENTREHSFDSIYLGTCSTDQESCVPHQEVTDVQVEIILKGNNVPDRVITAELESE